MAGTGKAASIFLTLLILAILTATALAIGSYLNKEEKHPSAPLTYITVVMEKRPPVRAVFEDESVYDKMRELQKKKIERNRELMPAIKEKEKQKEEYIKRRRNWVRYIDGKIVTGYDPQYDDAFDSGGN